MTETSDTWKLIFAGQYEEALPDISEDNWSQGHNLGTLLLALRRFEEAEKAFSGTPEDTSAHGEKRGTCAWLQNKPEKALQFWKQAQEALYQDAAGGVIPRALSYYAAIRLGDENEKKLALKGLKKIWKPNKTLWPGPVAGFLLGHYPEEEFTWHEFNAPPELEERRQVQRDFWKGVVRLGQSDLVGAKEYFAKAYRPCGRGILEVEHFLARHELERLQSLT